MRINSDTSTLHTTLPSAPGYIERDKNTYSCRWVKIHWCTGGVHKNISQKTNKPIKFTVCTELSTPGVEGIVLSCQITEQSIRNGGLTPPFSVFLSSLFPPSSQNNVGTIIGTWLLLDNHGD